MNYRIISEPTFLREVKRLSKKYKSLKQDLERLQEELFANPTAGADLGDGVHKVRMAIAMQEPWQKPWRTGDYIRISDRRGKRHHHFAHPLR